MLDGFGVWLSPLEKCLQLWLVANHICFFEKNTRLFVQELVWDDELLLLLGIRVASIDNFKDSLDVSVFFHQLECFDGSDTANRMSIITAAHDAEINELIHVHSKSFEERSQVYLGDRLLLAVKATEQVIRSEGQGVHILSGRAECQSHFAHLSALGFSLTWSIDVGHSHELN